MTTNQNPSRNEDDADDDSDDEDVAFASMDFAGVNFDDGDDAAAAASSNGAEEGRDLVIDSCDEAALSVERECLLFDSYGGPREGAEGGTCCVGGEPLDGTPDTAAETTTDGNDGVEQQQQQRRAAVLRRVQSLAALLRDGEYVAALKSESALIWFGTGDDDAAAAACDASSSSSVTERMRRRVMTLCTTVASAVEVELLGAAALNLFLQVNYTGPSLDEKGVTPTESHGGNDPLEGVDPHDAFRDCLRVTTPCDDAVELAAKGDETKVEEPNGDSENHRPRSSRNGDKSYHNSVLLELSVDGDWPCQVVQIPYVLLLARSVLLTLAHPDRASWSDSIGGSVVVSKTPPENRLFSRVASKLTASQLWSARAAVAHQRLLQGDEPSATLWDEVCASYRHCIASFCPDDNDGDRRVMEEGRWGRSLAARTMLEWGLAQHHFEREGKGKKAFIEAKEIASLTVEVTGAEGRRTKYQQKATAQMLVKAKSSSIATGASRREEGTGEEKGADTAEKKSDERVKSQMIEHDDEGILLERINFEDEEENRHHELSELDLCILLALCLDVKNTNPMDGLTGEQMGGYLERILHQHDDWMIYATALLERAWLECERTHARERAILQIQALADQHTNRLTLTQSTFKAAVEDSAPPQERLRNLHCIVYPPRWAMLRDLAERYAKIGAVSTAAEIFEELELWDEVVECYRAAEKEGRAEKIVRERLAEAETPRMWAALGDLTRDPKCFERSLELSNGRFASAHVALGNYYFEKGDLRASFDCFKRALKVKPLQPAVWFRFGTVSMRLGEWETALNAFTEVVQQEPEEGDAWANVAAIHIHNKNPVAAYPALIESLKQKRTNWRVWISKLYTCIDLKKYDEAMQACIQLLDFRAKKNASEEIPPLEEKCVRTIVGGTLTRYEEAVKANDAAAVDSARRSLSRVRELLTRLGSTAKSEPWIWETSAYFNARVGLSDQVLEDLMKEYRSLQSIRSWETDEEQMSKVCQVTTQISELHKNDGSKESLVKCKFLLKSVTKKIRAAYFDREIPQEAAELEKVLAEIEDLIAAA